ncbi:MAG: hypothetical protein U0V75_08700 [Ferruginibacter sp.]
MAVLGLQYYLIFRQNHISAVVDAGTNFGVVLAPFEVCEILFAQYSSIVCLSSFFFPLVYIIRI